MSNYHFMLVKAILVKSPTSIRGFFFSFWLLEMTSLYSTGQGWSHKYWPIGKCCGSKLWSYPSSWKSMKIQRLVKVLISYCLTSQCWWRSCMFFIWYNPMCPESDRLQSRFTIDCFKKRVASDNQTCQREILCIEVPMGSSSMADSPVPELPEANSVLLRCPQFGMENANPPCFFELEEIESIELDDPYIPLLLNESPAFNQCHSQESTWIPIDGEIAHWRPFFIRDFHRLHRIVKTQVSMGQFWFYHSNTDEILLEQWCNINLPFKQFYHTKSFPLLVLPFTTPELNPAQWWLIGWSLVVHQSTDSYWYLGCSRCSFVMCH